MSLGLGGDTMAWCPIHDKKALTGERFGSWEEFAVLGVAHTPRVCGQRMALGRQLIWNYLNLAQEDPQERQIKPSQGESDITGLWSRREYRDRKMCYSLMQSTVKYLHGGL